MYFSSFLLCVLVTVIGNHSLHTFGIVRSWRALSLTQSCRSHTPHLLCGNRTLQRLGWQHYMLTPCFTGLSSLPCQFTCPRYFHRKCLPQAPYKFQVPLHSGMTPSLAQPGSHSATINKSCFTPLALHISPVNLTSGAETQEG